MLNSTVIFSRLTLTWDVLKQVLAAAIFAIALLGLTLTWDVLKHNIWLIPLIFSYGLTLTWDVLKLVLMFNDSSPFPD